MNFSLLLLLAFLAGGTILIGLPVGRLQGFNRTLRASLSMFAAGILVFLLVEILGQACGNSASAVRAAVSGTESAGQAVFLVFLLLGGFLMGYVGLVGIEQKIIRSGSPLDPERLSFMIAVGIGLHNLSEGLAIGQAFAQGMKGLTLSLIVGFGLHNATEGFGILGPMVREGRKVSWKNIFLLAAIGGGPTFLGTLLGSLWTSIPLSVFVLAMAGGALLYVLKELLHGARKEVAQVAVMATLAFGFTLGWGTEVVADMAQSPSGAAVDADGDQMAPSASVSGPSITPAESAAQQQAADGVLREKAMEPKILADGTREYELTASVFPWEVFPGVRVKAWGYNGQVPGPLLRLKVGQRVRFVVKNELPQPTTVHWHGLAVPNSQDGVPGATQDCIPPHGQFVYGFTVTPQMIGTHLYHTHVNDDFQMDRGLHGVLIVDPAQPGAPYDVDAVYEMSSFKIGGSDQENLFALDGKAYPEAPALTVPLGAKVLLRLVNASAEESHVMHLHGYTFRIVALDGNALAHPISADTVLLAPSQTADVSLVASNPGLWMFHCHILDHMINPGPAGDGSETEIPAMGGLMTYLDVVPPAKVRAGYVAASSLDGGHLCR